MIRRLFLFCLLACSIVAVAQPNAPVLLDMTPETDTGTYNNDNLTRNRQPDFTGLADSGVTITVYINEAAVAVTSSTQDGNWSYTPDAPLADGDYALAATATDAQNNTSEMSNPLAFAIDSTPPAPPSAPELTTGTDTGISNTDRITNDSTPTFTGTTEPFARIGLYINGETPILFGVADENGVWTITPPVALNPGSWSFGARAIDVAGNLGDMSAITTTTIDTSPPVATISPVQPNPTSSAVSSVDVQLSEAVYGLDLSHVSLLRDGTTVTLSGVSLTGGPLSYQVTGLASLTSQDGAYVLQVAGGYTDAAGNAAADASMNWTKAGTVNLAVSMTAVPDVVTTVGQSVVYTITVTNSGPAVATNVQLTDVPTTNGRPISWVQSQGVVTPQMTGPFVNGLDVNLDTIDSGESAQLEVTILATETGTLTNMATVSADLPDGDSSDDSASKSVEVNLGPGPDILGHGVLLSSGCKTTSKGTNCTYKTQLLLSNRGTVDAGKSRLATYLSLDPYYDVADTPLLSKSLGKVKLGRVYSKTQNIKLVGSHTAQYILVRVDADNLVPEASEYNNLIVIGPLP